MNVRLYIKGLVRRLRRPERLVPKLRPLVTMPQVPSLAELEEDVRRQGVEIVHTDLGPRVYGLAHQTNEGSLILLQPALKGSHREFTLAHEFGHVQLHHGGQVEEKHVVLPTVGSIEDVEADIFALAYLVRDAPLPEQISRITRYVRTDPTNLRRWCRLFLYPQFYDLRLKIAALLEALFLRDPAQGAR